MLPICFQFGKGLLLEASKPLKRLARPRGVEPLTPRSVVWCSIQLSYGRVPAVGRPQLLHPGATRQGRSFAARAGGL